MLSGNTWNWQQPDWPQFRFEGGGLAALEADFLRCSGVLTGAIRHLADEERQQLTVEFIGDEALSTSEIEGESLNRDSLLSSIRRNLGLPGDNRRVPPAEQGIARMMVEMRSQFAAPLTGSRLCHWHERLMSGRRDLANIGGYRADQHPMQVVSGPIHEPKIHFEAPPSARVPAEMRGFIRWFNDTAPRGKAPIPALTRAGIAHLYFETIHPFEDGNGRIGRAIVEMVISQAQGEPALLALSHIINAKKRRYYEMLEPANKGNEITGWLLYFAETIIEAQQHAVRAVDFTIAKAKLLAHLHGRINERQQKALLRMFREGPEGFKGGLSAENYMRITGASRATTTRDLHGLAELGALRRSGVLKATRYHLPLGLE